MRWELPVTGGVPAGADDLLAGATERPTGCGREAPGLRGPVSPKMLRGFTPRSGALSSSSQPGGQQRRGPGAPPSEGETPSSQEGPEPRPALLTLLSPLTTLSGPGREGRGGHLAKLALGLSLWGSAGHSVPL